MEWASDVRWWVMGCYALMIAAVIYTYLKLSNREEGDGFAQDRRKGRRRLKEGRRDYDGEPTLHTGWGTTHDKETDDE